MCVRQQWQHLPAEDRRTKCSSFWLAAIRRTAPSLPGQITALTPLNALAITVSSSAVWQKPEMPCQHRIEDRCMMGIKQYKRYTAICCITCKQQCKRPALHSACINSSIHVHPKQICRTERFAWRHDDEVCC